MVIRVDKTIGPDDESRSLTLGRLRRTGTAARSAFILRSLKEKIVEGGRIGSVILLGHLNDDHSRRDDFKNFRESAVQLVNDILSGISRGRRNGGGGAGFRLGQGRRGAQQGGGEPEGENE